MNYVVKLDQHNLFNLSFFLFFIKQENPAEPWLSDKAWTEVVFASRLLPHLQRLMDNFRENARDWRRWYDSVNPQDENLPQGLEKLE